MAYRTTLYRAQLTIQTNRMATRRLRKIMDDVEQDARILALGGPYSKTGRLSKSIRSEGPFPRGTRVTGWVGSRLSYAASVELGAEVHDIFPRGAVRVYRFFGSGYNAAPKLKFYWRKAGRTVFTPQVPMGPGKVGISHPGQRGKRYITKALAKAAIKWRMNFILYQV